MDLIVSLSKKLKWLIYSYHNFSVLLFFCVLYTLFFSPVIFSGRLLAPGDGIIQSVPAFYSSRSLWTDLLHSGFPVAADPQVQTWYPLSLMFSFIPNSWNIFVVSAYVLASCFSYGYVYTLTSSKLAATSSGIVYGMSGFMMAHLGHTMMIHSAAWMPLMIWALEKLRHSFSINWAIAGCISITCSILSGHPQIAIYTIGIGALYTFVLGQTTAIGRWNYYKLYIAIVAMGIALSSIQIIPTIELMNLGVRSNLIFEEFITYSLPVKQISQLIFPYIFGGYDSYLGQWNLTEVTGYIGLLPIVLATIGFLSSRYKSITHFWLCICLLALLLATATPILTWLMYHVPGYNKFRVPARHFVEMALGISVLAGLGISSIQERFVSNRLILRVILISICVILISLLYSTVFYYQLQAKSVSGELRIFPWLSPAMTVPLLIFIVEGSALIYWHRLKRSKFRQLLLLLSLTIDLSSFGWFYEWQYAAPSKVLLSPTVSSQHYKKVLRTSHQRILPIGGGFGDPSEIPPNMSRLWGMPSASGYGPLMLSRISKLFPMDPAGRVSAAFGSEIDRTPDIMSIRYVFLPKVSLTVPNLKEVNWPDINVSASLSQQHNSIQFRVLPHQAFPNPTAIGIVSSLGSSTSIINNAEILRIRVTDSKGNVATQDFRAGRDTSEWAYDCADVLPLMQHRRASIFESFPVTRNTSFCNGHKYISIRPLGRLGEIRDVKLEYLGSSGAIDVQKISIVDYKTKQSYPVTETESYLANANHWHHIEDSGRTSIFENLRAMPRAWIVQEVVNLAPDEVLSSIKSSKLPDGRSYDPSQVALIEQSSSFKSQPKGIVSNAKIISLSDTQIDVQTNSSTDAFLVLSDTYYPGWEASIDGKPLHLFQTNYVLRGVLIPSGNHVVRFEFKPRSFYFGATISIVSLISIGYLCFRFNKKQKFIPIA